jgi:hypothetical protein
MKPLLISCLLMLIPVWVTAETAIPKSAPVPEPPQLSTVIPDVESPTEDEETAPEITVIREKERTIQEYRRNGQLFMIKVTPDIGPEYYFIDRDGDGQVNDRLNDLDKGSNVQQWKLWQWH